jgi:UDP-galactopyranose mutase
MNFLYDYLIVGAGLFGSVFAHEVSKKGKKCLIIDKRNHIGGNVYTENIDGINVHKYGAHIFHTSNKEVWEFVNSFVEFNRYTNSPIINFKGQLYNLPFNMNTFYQLWGVKSPEEAKNKINEQRTAFVHITKPKNLEEQALVLVGNDIYEKLIKGYTEKQWGRKATEIPAFIIRRLPFRFTFDNNYFNDTYQGIPIGGYTKLVEALLKGIEVRTNTDYFENKDIFDNLAKVIVFSGKIDEFYNYKFGNLEYRSLEFKHNLLNTDNYQGNAVINYSEAEIPYTRIIEHKHFEFGTQPKTIITYEFSKEWEKGDEPYYPINDNRNEEKLKKYSELAEKEDNVIFGGRLAEYKYYDMHQVVEKALILSKEVKQ